MSVNELFITITHIVNQDSDKASFYEKYLQLLESNLIQEAFSRSSQKLKESITDTEAFIRKVRNEEIGDKDIISVNQENLLIELYELRKVAQQYNQLVINKLFPEKNLFILSLSFEDLNEITITERLLMEQAEKVSGELENIINASNAEITVRIFKSWFRSHSTRENNRTNRRGS